MKSRDLEAPKVMLIPSLPNSFKQLSGLAAILGCNSNETVSITVAFGENTKVETIGLTM